MKVIGFRRNDFHAEATERFEAGEITGMDIFFAYPLEGGNGQGATRIYFTDKKLLQSNYQPTVGDEVELTYNRYGKVSAIKKIK